MIPSSPPDGQHFDQYQSVDQTGDGGVLSFPDPQNPQIDYAHLLPTHTYVFWTTQQESRMGCWRSMFRKIVAHYSGGVTHVELAFQFYNNKVIGVASYQDRTVELFIRSPEHGAYDPVYGKWTHVPLNLSEAERFHAWRFCLTQYGKPYNALGLRSFIPCIGCCLFCCCYHPSAEDGSTWFCSQLVVAAIQYCLQHNARLRQACLMVLASKCKPNDALEFINKLGIVAASNGLTVVGDPKAQLAEWWRKEAERDNESRRSL